MGWIIVDAIAIYYGIIGHLISEKGYSCILRLFLYLRYEGSNILDSLFCGNIDKPNLGWIFLLQFENKYINKKEMQHTKAVFWMIINSGKLTILNSKITSILLIGILFISCVKEEPCVKSGIPSNIDITDEVKAKITELGYDPM